jgi:hypothetical protein
MCLIFTLAGCQRSVFIDLLNESDAPIQVVDTSKGRNQIKTIPSHGRLLLFSTNPLVIESCGKKQEYFLRSFPSQFVRSEFKGRVVTLAFGSDAKLYLLTPDEKPPATRVVPQPEPFPVTGEVKT